ncbi:MAG: uncharacterized protein JWQ16_2382 [Novosphingobium sp.]|nr:uncharacterized protein [Novosphingobium sp.]
MNDRYGWDDRNDSDRYRRHSSEDSNRTDNQARGQDRGRGENDWGSQGGSSAGSSNTDRPHQGRSDFDRGQRQGGGGNYGARQSYASQGDAQQAQARQRRYSSSEYGYGSGQQGGDASSQPYFTGQQQGWEVPSSYGAPGTFGASYGGGSSSYGGAGGSQGFGEDYREHGRGQSGGGRQHERGFLERAGDEVASWFGDSDAARRREEDHRGRGPADYTRSDERIREDANDRLTEDSRVDARSISVTVQGGEVTLSGTVSRREDKRRAEDIVEDLSGVKHVQNNLRVQQDTSWSGSNSSASGTASSFGTAASGSTAASISSSDAKDAVTKDRANTAPT